MALPAVYSEIAKYFNTTPGKLPWVFQSLTGSERGVNLGRAIKLESSDLRTPP